MHLEVLGYVSLTAVFAPRQSMQRKVPQGSRGRKQDALRPATTARRTADAGGVYWMEGNLNLREANLVNGLTERDSGKGNGFTMNIGIILQSALTDLPPGNGSKFCESL